MIVSSLADDVLDSMRPRDTDGDGVVEERGPLGNSGESLEPFLPEDERERRRKSTKHARWAINVSSADQNNSSPSNSPVSDQRCCQYLALSCERCRSYLVQLALLDCISSRFCPRSPLHSHHLDHQQTCRLAIRQAAEKVPRWPQTP